MDNNNYFNVAICDSILNHLNKTCSYGNVFQKKITGNPPNQLQYIVLKQNNKSSHNFWLTEIIKDSLDRLYIALPKLCKKQIAQQVNNIVIPTCFVLELSQDQVTKQQLLMPFKVMTKDKLISCPIFCDFIVFLEKIQRSKLQSEEIESIDADEYYIILLMWKIRGLLNYQYKNKATFEIILYPKNHNFGICKKEDNTEILYFNSIEHINQFLEQNSKFDKQSTAIVDALLSKKLIEFQIQLLESFKNSDELSQRQQDSKKKTEEKVQNKKQGTELQLETKQDKKYFYPITCQSTLCLNDDLQNNLRHFIIFEENVNPKCQCGKELDPYSSDTLIIDYKLREVLDRIILYLHLKIDQYEEIITSNPLFIEIEIDQYKNQFVNLFYKEKINNIEKKTILRKEFFQGKFLNFDIHLIQDKKETNLFEYNEEEEIHQNQIYLEQQH